MTTRFASALRRRDFIHLFLASTSAAVLLPACGDDAGGTAGMSTSDAADSAGIDGLSPDSVMVNPDVPIADVRSMFFDVSHTDGNAPLRIGEQYISLLESDPNVATLADVIQPTADLIGSVDSVDAAVQLLRDTIEAEFAATDLVMLQGWVFARTELNLCALATLTIA